MTIMKRSRALLTAALLLSAAACDQTPRPQSQFGSYPEHPKQLQLQDGQQFAIYCVKYWHFADGGPPALQLEYDPHLPVTDTARLRLQLAEIWPAFGPYVEAAHSGKRSSPPRISASCAQAPPGRRRSAASALPRNAIRPGSGASRLTGRRSHRWKHAVRSGSVKRPASRCCGRKLRGLPRRTRRPTPDAVVARRLEHRRA
jgi:hypothetical protein